MINLSVNYMVFVNKIMLIYLYSCIRSLSYL